MPTLTNHVPPAFHLLAKPTGAICNLDCQYCFFLSKEELYPGSRFRMTDEVLEAYIQQGMTQRSIVAELNRVGIKTRRGREWTLVQVQRTLRRLQSGLK